MEEKEISSIPTLCFQLVSSAIQRCRMSQQLSRLSVLLKCFPSSVTRISISDTGVGCCVEEFEALKFAREGVYLGNWDGVVSVTTTGFSDNEIYNYQLNVKEFDSARKVKKLPSNSKNRVKFSGTEISLSTLENVNILREEITCFFQKLLVLRIPRIAIEVVVESDIGSIQEKVIEWSPSPLFASSTECLVLGFEDYILRHHNKLAGKCDTCFPNQNYLKMGSGVACWTENHRSTGQVVEAVIIISEFSEPPFICCDMPNLKTQVLSFKDFSPCVVSQTSVDALQSIHWKSYGLALRGIVNSDGCAVMEWENLDPSVRIDIALHCYHKQVTVPVARKKSQFSRNLIKKALKKALIDLKEKHAGVLLSVNGLKVRGYAPDLAKTISGLIMSSNDTDFQGECFSLLGLQSREIGGEVVEECIEQKIIAAIEMTDKKPQGIKEAAPLLFGEDPFSEPDFLDEAYGEGEEAFSYTD